MLQNGTYRLVSWNTLHFTKRTASTNTHTHILDRLPFSTSRGVIPSTPPARNICSKTVKSGMLQQENAKPSHAICDVSKLTFFVRYFRHGVRKAITMRVVWNVPTHTHVQASDVRVHVTVPRDCNVEISF